MQKQKIEKKEIKIYILTLFKKWDLAILLGHIGTQRLKQNCGT